jgi:hypothetical protein
MAGMADTLALDFPADQVPVPVQQATIEGTVTFLLAKPVVLAILPLKEGASTRVGDNRYTIARLLIESRAVEISLVTEAPSLPFDRLYSKLNVLIINKAAGQALSQSGGSGDFGRFNGYAYNSVTLTQEDFPGRSGSWADWIAAAQVYLVSVESAPRQTVPFHMDGIPLNPIPRLRFLPGSAAYPHRTPASPPGGTTAVATESPSTTATDNPRTSEHK